MNEEAALASALAIMSPLHCLPALPQAAAALPHLLQVFGHMSPSATHSVTPTPPSAPAFLTTPHYIFFIVIYYALPPTMEALGGQGLLMSCSLLPPSAYNMEVPKRATRGLGVLLQMSGAEKASLMGWH